jgi:hypothetical protein
MVWFPAKSMVRSAASALLVGCALSACGSGDDTAGWAPPMVMRADFRNEVYPILLRDCAFHTCHGSEQRFFRVWGPGRVRMGGRSAFDCLPTDDMVMLDGQMQCRSLDEVDATMDSARGFIDPQDPRRSLLLRKPLSTEAGGMGHLGVDKFGRNLYRTTDSPGYLALSSWVYEGAD